jgi:DNA-directed RNA polymerase subunit beta'
MMAARTSRQAPNAGERGIRTPGRSSPSTPDGRFENVEEGVTVAKQIDDVTGLSTLVVIDPEAQGQRDSAKGVRPQVKLLDAAGNEVKIAGTEHPGRDHLPGRLADHREGWPGRGTVGDVLARIPQEGSEDARHHRRSAASCRVVRGSRPKDKGRRVLAEVTGTVSFGKDTKGKQRLVITDPDGKAHEYLIPKDKHVTRARWPGGQPGELIVDGPADPHDILRLQGMEALARYIIDEVQDVYRLQGVKINDKHIEVIVRQMLRRVQRCRSGRCYRLHRRASRLNAQRCCRSTTELIAQDKQPASL